MTDAEIISALKIHSNDQFDNCEGCPYLQGDECTGYAVHSQPFRDVLDLINRQKAEIEKKTTQCERLEIYMDELVNQKLNHSKSEAIKEFERKSENRLIELYEKYHKIANKPKKETDMFYQGRAEAIWECITINRNLVKEMAGDDK